jgi:O-succinylbenzoic acid--CoA ligase
MDPHTFVKASTWSDESTMLLTAEGAESIDAKIKRSFVFRTSGTTGGGSNIVLQKTGILTSAHCVNEHLEVKASSVWGLILPWWHVGGMGVAARAYVAGCRMAYFSQRGNAQAACAWIEQEAITHLSLVPTQVHDICLYACRAPSSLQAVVVGGGILGESDAMAARELDWPLLRSFGMTEASSQIATQSLTDAKQTIASCDLQILDCWQVRTNDEGLLEIAGEPLFSGIMRQESGVWNFQERQGQWWTTQDRVAIEGNKLRWQGRSDDVVKILGELVSVSAVEASLARAGMSVGTYAVVACADERKGHALHLFCETANERELGVYHERCAGYARISCIHVMSLPRTELGKIRRGELKNVLGVGS